MSPFQDFGVTITLRKRPAGVTSMLSFFFIQRCLRGTPLGFCLRVIVKEKPINHEKATFSVLSVLFLIYDCEI